MFLFLFLSVAFSDQAIFQDDFLNGFKYWNNGNNTNPSSAVLVECPQLTNKKCFYLSEKRNTGGDLYSKTITIDTNQDLVVEFKYLTLSSKKRGLYSNLIAGYTNPRKSGYCYTASGFPSTHPMYDILRFGTNPTTSQKEAYLCQGLEGVVVQDLADGWKTIRSVIPSQVLKTKSMTSLQLIFEDHKAFEDTLYENAAGAYYITDVVVSYNGKCTAGCAECSTFFECSKCSEGYNYLGGRCYQVDCANSLTNTVPYDKVILTQNQNQLSYEAIIKIPGYNLFTCWAQQWVTLESHTGKFTQIPFFINPFVVDEAKIIITPNNVTALACDASTSSNIFSCNFHFNVHYNEQTLFEMNYTHTLDFTAIKAQMVIPFSTKIKNLPALAVAVESDVYYCTGDLNNCQWRNSETLKLVLNQRFKVKLVLKDTNLNSWEMQKGYVNLTGNGTLLPLTITNTDTSTQGQIVYTVQLVIKGYKGVNIEVSAIIQNPLNAKSSNNRRMLSENTQINYDQFTSQTISDISIKSRELIEEPDPKEDWSIILSICLSLVLFI